MFSSALKKETVEVLGDDIDNEHRVEFLKETMQRVDYTAYGGAPLLGINGHSLIGHGRSTPRAIANGIRAAAQGARKCPLQDLQKALDDVAHLGKPQ
jgi:glycerol-3-phosphate acyltransferase PlsX